MKLATNIHHMSGHCWTRLKGQRSKVKVNWRRHTFRRCDVNAHLLANIFVSKSSFECLLFFLFSYTNLKTRTQIVSLQLLIIAFCASMLFLFFM